MTADTLSRAPLAETQTTQDKELQEDAEVFLNSIVTNLPISDVRLRQLREEQQKDPVCSELMTYVIEGWPESAKIKGQAKLFVPFQAELTVLNGILFRGSRLVIPDSMQNDILMRIHDGHQGIVKCRDRARSSVWWPRMSKQIEEFVRNCTTCAKDQKNCAEPLMTTPFPSRPWQRIATDLFELRKDDYLLVIDYFSRYAELAKLSTTTSPSVITHLKSMFARHGCPETLVSDNGPQYASEKFAKFSEQYGFEHITSSPRYPQSNGEIEKAVRTVKEKLRTTHGK